MNSTITRPGPLTWTALTGPARSQLARFAAVGAGGYLVNLTVFTLIRHAAGDSLLASASAFAAAVAHNFAWNRRWTFTAGAGRPGQQALRFLTVSIAALALTLGLLWVLTRPAALPTLPAEAIATIAVTPASFAGSRLWAFAAGPRHLSMNQEDRCPVTTSVTSSPR